MTSAGGAGTEGGGGGAGEEARELETVSPSSVFESSLERVRFLPFSVSLVGVAVAAGRAGDHVGRTTPLLAASARRFLVHSSSSSKLFGSRPLARGNALSRRLK
jgi:hypothetical protein